MIKTFLIVILWGILLLCVTACGENSVSNSPPTEATTSGKTTAAQLTTSKTSVIESPSTKATTIKTTGQPKNDKAAEPIFNTENITRITFYAYYGQGTGSAVPAENMTAITGWLSSFTVGEKAPDILPPGTNTYYIEIAYLDGTVVKKGLDTIKINGTVYYLNCDETPDCFREILSKTSFD